MRNSRGVGFDLVLACVATPPFAGWGMWYWPWEDGWLGGWPVIISFAACFGLARVIGEFCAGWPGLDAPNPESPIAAGPPDRPVTLAEVAALGVGAAALLAFGWVITQRLPVN